MHMDDWQTIIMFSMRVSIQKLFNVKNSNEEPQENNHVVGQTI